MYYRLNIKILSDDPVIVDYYKNYKCDSDSGVDLIVPNDVMVSVFNTESIDHLIQCRLDKVYNEEFEMMEDSPFFLLPRSSISKTNFRMANSVGLIDKSYRGNILAKVDLKPRYNVEEKTRKLYVHDQKEIIKKHSRLFQIVTPDLNPIKCINIVDKLDETVRNTSGFGSTGFVGLKNAFES